MIFTPFNKYGLFDFAGILGALLVGLVVCGQGSWIPWLFTPVVWGYGFVCIVIGAVWSIMNFAIPILLIMFGLALFTVPEEQEFRAFVQKLIEYSMVLETDQTTGNSVTRFVYRHWTSMMLNMQIESTVIIPLGFCRLAICEIKNRPTVAKFVGIYKTWIPLDIFCTTSPTVEYATHDRANENIADNIIADVENVAVSSSSSNDDDDTDKTVDEIDYEVFSGTSLISRDQTRTNSGIRDTSGIPPSQILSIDPTVTTDSVWSFFGR